MTATVDTPGTSQDDVTADLEAALAAILDDDWEAPEDNPTPDELAAVDMATLNDWGQRRDRVERRRKDVKAEHARLVGPLLAVIARANAEIALHDAWAAAKDAPLARSADWLDASMKSYALLLRDRTAGLGPKQIKSVKTPHVTVTTRESGGGLLVTDEEQALAWADRAHPEMVKRALRRAEAAKVLQLTEAGVVDKTTGGVVEGVAFEPKKLTASVKLANGSVNDTK